MPAPPVLEFDMSGLFIVAQGPDLRDLVIADVAPGSAAEKSGLAAGDHLVSIDGRDVRTMTLGQVRALLRGPAGKRVMLATRTADHLRRTELVLARRV